MVIGIETDDDVAVLGARGSLREQDKHSDRDSAKPFGDRSKDLWNTLAIWLDAIEKGHVKIETTRFLMVTNKTLSDCIFKHIGRAETQDEISACIAALEKVRESPPDHISNLVNRVMRAESREALRALLVKTDSVDASDATGGAELRRKTIEYLQLPSWCSCNADSILDELRGWLHKVVLATWEQSEPAWVQRNHFVNQLYAIIDRRKRQMCRERAENLIPVTDDIVGQEKGRPFVKQLYLVTGDDAVVETSIRDYIRCNIEKIRLSREGDVTDADWAAFQQALQSRWGKIHARVIRMRAGTLEEDVGFEIFTETTEDYREKLAGTDTEQVYLTSGTYHRLADLLSVGWHPRYLDLMKESLETQ
ncbi:MAG: hypothetical protein KGM47_13050 [Acidobacteriota bacterium]|nr:hypothetical protein [Acidobacteriota bacterium]